jgi:hypothetical protein
MHDAILTIHGTNCPSTNLHIESFEPIDAIFCSRAIPPIRAGFLGSNAGCPSDHIQLWADFEKSDLIGGPIDKFHNHVGPLNIHDPHLVEAYNLKSFSQLQEETILTQLKELDKISSYDFTEDHIKRYNDLCQLNTSIRQGVKSNLRHLFMGKHAWSPEWAQSKLIKQLWLQVLRYRLLQQGLLRGRNGKLRQKVSLTQIRRLMRATDCKDALTFSIPELDLKLLDAKKKHKETTNNCAQLRCAHVDKLDEARANHNQTSVVAERAQRKQTQRQ